MNAHDIDALIACFDPAYESVQPGRPAESFVGTERVRRNWSRNFETVPDLRAAIVRSVVDGDSVWAEWRYRGTRTDGSPYDVRAVILHTAREGLIAAARLYFAEADQPAG